MSQGAGSPAELRAEVNLTRNEIGHLWSGGILPLALAIPLGRGEE